MYQHSLLENEEIKRQIEELLQKGTFDQAPHLAEAQSCLYERKTGRGEFVLITKL